MIEAHELTKVYGEKTAVDRASFVVEPGKVTGFLGPNGSGKSTTMRMIAGLDRPTSGSVFVNGKSYHHHHNPLAQVGALLDAKAVHKSRSARNHLRALAATHGIGRKRVEEVIELTGLTPVADKRAGGFSLGMGQRLGIAAAMLGDPAALMLDEPVNGLDPEGVKWVRTMVRALAAQGRTVFLSSHLMSEMAQTADHLIVIGRGRIIKQGPVSEVIAGAGQVRVVVETPQAAELIEALSNSTFSDAAPTYTLTGPHQVAVTGLSSKQVGELAWQHQIQVHSLAATEPSLEEAYLNLTHDEVEYQSNFAANPA